MNDDEDLIGVRCWFIQPRYTYRGKVTRFRGSLAIVDDVTKVVDLGPGKSAPNEEISLPDGWRIDRAACEAYGPEPSTWTKTKR